MMPSRRAVERTVLKRLGLLVPALNDVIHDVTSTSSSSSSSSGGERVREHAEVVRTKLVKMLDRADAFIEDMTGLNADEAEKALRDRGVAMDRAVEWANIAALGSLMAAAVREDIPSAWHARFWPQLVKDMGRCVHSPNSADNILQSLTHTKRLPNGDDTKMLRTLCYLI